MSPWLLVGMMAGWALAPLVYIAFVKLRVALLRINPWRCPYESGSRCPKWDKHWVNGDPNHSWDY